MSDEKPASKVPGWLKALFTTVFGVVSGAIIMYLTPLVNNVIKPAKPVPNFAQQANGLTVVFNNRSTGGTQGWWDFGDGSALEPFEPSKDSISHTFARPGTYNVKLSLQNLLGEEAERTVAVNLDASVANLPVIEAFAVVPLTPGERAPATYKIISQVKNAKVVAWAIGDAPLKTETNPSPEKFITLEEPGYFNLRLVAFNGDQFAEKSKQVYVDPNAGAKPMATLKIVYDGVPTEQKKDHQTIVLAWDPKHQGATCPVSRELAAAAGWTIVEAKFPEPPSTEVIRNIKAELSAERTKLRISGELLKTRSLTSKGVPPPQCAVHVDLVLAKRSGKASRTSDPVMFELTAPGTTMLPLPPPPPGLEVQAKRITLEIKDGAQVLWNSPGLPNAAQVAVKNRPMRVTALEQGGQLRLDVVDATGAVPVSFPKK